MKVSGRQKGMVTRDACQHLMLNPTSLPQEQAAKTKMRSVLRIQQKEYLALFTVISRLLVSITSLSSNQIKVFMKSCTKIQNK